MYKTTEELNEDKISIGLCLLLIYVLNRYLFLNQSLKPSEPLIRIFNFFIFLIFSFPIFIYVTWSSNA